MKALPRPALSPTGPRRPGVGRLVEVRRGLPDRARLRPDGDGAAPRERPPSRFRPADRLIPIRPRHVHAADLVPQPRGAGVFQPGLPVDVRVCQDGGRPILSRGAEAGPELCHLLLGRSVGLGSLREWPDDGGACRPRTCGDPERRSHSPPPMPTQRNRPSSAQWRCGMSSASTLPRASSRTARMPTPWLVWPRHTLTISTSRPCTRRRCSCCCPGPQPLPSTNPQSRACWRPSRRRWRTISVIPARAICTST